MCSSDLSIRNVVDKEVVTIIEGKYGVGKTSLLHSFIHSYKNYLAATATFSSNEIAMGSWILRM